MNKIMNSVFVKMCRQGILGALLGIIAGMLLGILIFFLQFPLIWINGLTDANANFSNYSGGIMFFSLMQPGTLGMSFGAIIGAIFGSISALRNKKDE